MMSRQEWVSIPTPVTESERVREVMIRHHDRPETQVYHFTPPLIINPGDLLALAIDEQGTPCGYAITRADGTTEQHID